MANENLDTVMQQLAEQMRDYNENLSRFARASSSNEKNPYANFSITELKGLAESTNKLKTLTNAEIAALQSEINHRNKLGETLGKNEEAIKHSIEAETKRRQAVEASNVALRSATTGLLNFSKTIDDISGDVSKVGQTIKGFGEGVADLLKPLGAGFRAAAIGLQAFTTIMSTALDQTQKLLKAFDEVASVGGATRETSESIRKLGREAGYTVENLPKFTQIIKNLNVDLVGLGGSANAGVKTFSKMAAVGNQTYEAFNRLGVSQEELTEAQAGYVRQAIMSNSIAKKSPEELRKASLDYVETLVKLREISGQNLKQQQSALEAALAQRNFNAYINSRELQMQELKEKTAKMADGVEKKRIESEIATIQAEIDGKKAFAIKYSNLGDEAKTAILQGISTSGETVFSELVAKVEGGQGLAISAAQKLLNQGKTTEAMNLLDNSLIDAGKTQLKTAGQLAGIGNQFTDVANTLIFQVETMKERNRLESLSNEARLKEYESIQKATANRLKEGEIVDENGKVIGDGAKNTQNFFLTLGRTVGAFKDDVVAALNPFTSTTGLAAVASTSLAIAAGYAAAKLASFGKNLAGLGGLQLPGSTGGPTGAPPAPTGGGGKLGKIGAFAKGLLGKAGPLAAIMAITDAIQGFTADSKAGVGSSLINAGSSALHGMSFGLLGSSPEEIKKRSELGKLSEGTTTHTTEGGQKAVNVNIVGATAPINVNIEKVLDPLFRIAQTQRGGQADIQMPIPPGIEVPGVTAGRPSAAQSGGGSSGPGVALISRQVAAMRETLSGQPNAKPYSEQDLRQLGFNIKPGEPGIVQRQGANIDERLIELAKAIHAMVPGVVFTGFNDNYHDKEAPTSGHVKGRALDFRLPAEFASDREYRDQLREQLISMGAFVIDEYSYPSSKSTGGHFHVEIGSGRRPPPPPPPTDKKAGGGMILGPGSSTSDSVPAFNRDTGQPIALSTGEYVLPASITSMLGRGYLDSLISSPNTLKRQGGGSIPGEDGQRVISAAVDLGEGMREIIYSDGSRELSGGFGTRFFDPSGKLVKTRTPNFSGISKDIYADGTEDTHYTAGPLNVSKYASGRTSASYNAGLGKIYADTEQGVAIDIFNEDRTEKITSIDQINALLEQYKNDDNSDLKETLELFKELFQTLMDKNESLFSEMNSTLKDVVGELETSNSTQEDILNYSRI